MIGNMNMQVASHGAQSGQNNNSMMQMCQPQSRRQMPGISNVSHAPRLPSSMGQPILSNGIVTNVSSKNGIPGNIQAPGYNPVSQTSSMMNSPKNNASELPGNSFPLGSTPGISSLASKGAFNSEIKGQEGFTPSYDIFNDLNQHIPQKWPLHNVGMTNDASQHSNSLHGNLNLAQSLSVQPGFSSSQMNGHNRNAAVVSNAMFSEGNIKEHGNAQNVNQPINNLLVDN